MLLHPAVDGFLVELDPARDTYGGDDRSLDQHADGLGCAPQVDGALGDREVSRLDVRHSHALVHPRMAAAIPESRTDAFVIAINLLRSELTRVTNAPQRSCCHPLHPRSARYSAGDRWGFEARFTRLRER
jgi:hypothetical protein